jgi:hypothetical protein
MKLSMIFAAAAIPLAVGFPSGAVAQKNYGPGVTDTEIRIGQTAPYSGPLSSLSIFGRIEAVYLRKINESGGINGRKVTLISLDDAFSPPKTVEQTRKLNPIACSIFSVLPRTRMQGCSTSAMAIRWRWCWLPTKYDGLAASPRDWARTW